MEFRRTDLEKNTVGYAFAHDPIDWFIGSEGTLGIVVEAELALLPLPERVIGLATLLRDGNRRVEVRRRPVEKQEPSRPGASSIRRQALG